jgi:DNA-binding transcriptional regulator YiaG
MSLNEGEGERVPYCLIFGKPLPYPIPGNESLNQDFLGQHGHLTSRYWKPWGKLRMRLPALPFSIRMYQIARRVWVRGTYPVVPRTAGDRIRRARMDRGMTPGEFAGAVGRSRSTVKDWEAGRCPPRSSSWKRIRVVLGPIVGDLPEDYGRRIRTLRCQLGLTRAEFAELVGICERSIENLERHRNTPLPKTISKLTRALPQIWKK